MRARVLFLFVCLFVNVSVLSVSVYSMPLFLPALSLHKKDQWAWVSLWWAKKEREK